MTITAAEVAGHAAAAPKSVFSRPRRPIFLLVSEDRPRREALTADLTRRYDADYQVIGAASAGAALTMLADLADSGAVVALVFADERLAGLPAVDFLARAHGLHPGAKRVLLVARGDWSAAHPAVSAMALGKIDYHLWVPWYPERVLYSAVTEFLAAWDKSREPSFAAVRIAGPAHSARSHRLRDILSRGGVPYQFFDDGSAEGRQLLRQAGAESAQLPVAVYYDGTVLADPSPSRPDGNVRLPDTPAGGHLRCGHPRRRAGRPGRRGLRGLRGAGHRGAGAGHARRADRHQPADPQLPRVPARPHR